MLVDDADLQHARAQPILRQIEVSPQGRFTHPQVPGAEAVLVVQEHEVAAEASDEAVDVFGHALDKLRLRGAYGRRDDVNDHEPPLPSLQSTWARARDDIEYHLTLVDADGSFDTGGFFFSGRRRRKYWLRIVVGIVVGRFSGIVDWQF